MIRANVNLVAGLILLGALSGCISHKASEISYYSLMSVEHLGQEASAKVGAGLLLGVGPITIPDSLKRSQIATREADSRYRYSELHRWAGVLEKDMALVLGDNLGAMLGTEKVAFYPWMHHFKPTHRVILDVVRFDGSLDGDAVLSVRWAVTGPEGKAFLTGGKSVYRQPVESPDYAALVRAESLLLAELSREIAQKIDGLSH